MHYEIKVSDWQGDTMNPDQLATPDRHGRLAAVPAMRERRRPAFYNVAEAAEIMRIDESTLYRHLRNGRFPGVKIGGRYVVPHIALERLVDDVLSAGRCVDIFEWTGEWRANQAARSEQPGPMGMVAGGAAW